MSRFCPDPMSCDCERVTLEPPVDLSRPRLSEDLPLPLPLSKI